MAPEGKPGMRRYGMWAGNPGGQPEDLARCVEPVYPSWTRSPIPHQCSRNRGHGLGGEYCKQHAKKMAKQISADD